MPNLISRHKIVILLFLSSLSYFLFFSRYGIDMVDEGFYLHTPNLILKGLVPYRDFMLPFTPGSLYIQAFIYKIFSTAVIVGRFTTVFMGVCITILLYRISRFIVPSKNIAAIPGILFIFWGVPHLRHPWYGWYGLLSGLVFVYFGLNYLAGGKKLYLFFSGFFCGVTFLMKQNLGSACLVSYLLFLVSDGLFSGKVSAAEWRILFWRLFVFLTGAVLSVAPVILYLGFKKILPEFFYYIFKFAAVSAGPKFLANPYPHIKPASLFIFSLFLIFAWFLHNVFWGHKAVKRIFLALSAILIGAILFCSTLFIVRINEIDGIYVLDHIKTGGVNGFFNICALSIFLSAFILFRDIFKRRYRDKEMRPLLFITLFSIVYTWFALCIGRHHFHLVLGMPPAYILVGFMVYRGKDNLRNILARSGKDDLAAKRFSNMTVCAFPLILMSYFGFLTALKNEGFRAEYPPLTNMHSRLDLKGAIGIIVSEKEKNMLENITRYITVNTRKGERIFDTHKSLLFYFLSDRMQPSYYYIFNRGLFRAGEQERVIEDLKKHNVSLITTRKEKWDNLELQTDEGRNPLTFKIWRYISGNYRVDKDFGRYYILIRR